MKWKSTVIGLALWGAACPWLNSRAQDASLWVDLDAANLTGSTWSNAGALGSFIAQGNPAAGTVAGLPAVTLAGNGDAFVGPTAPVDLVGGHARTVEAWVYNRVVDDEETIVAWGRRGGEPDGSNMAFNYGRDTAVGAANHWGEGYNLGWGSAAPEAARWHYLVYSYDGATARVYRDGLPAAERVVALNTAADTAVAIGLQNDLNGQPQTALSATLSLSKLRIRSTALTASEVLSRYLADLGTLQSVAVRVDAKMVLGGKQSAVALGNYALLTGVPIPNLASGAFTSSDTNVLTVTTNGLIQAVGVGSAKILLSHQGKQTEQTVTVAAPAAAKLVHRYGFNEAVGSETTQDEVTATAAPLFGSAALSGTGSLTLDGADGYVDLPNGLVSGLRDVSFDLWVTWGDEGSTGERILDFGNSTAGEDAQGEGTRYLYLTPRGEQGGVRFAVNGGAGERALNAPAALTPGKETHLTVVYSYSTLQQQLYVDGLLVDTQPTDAPLSAIVDVNDWLGRSQFSTVPGFRGKLNEFRLYEGALTADQVLLHHAAGPDQVLEELGALKSLTWLAPTGTVMVGTLIQGQVQAQFQNGPGIDVTQQPDISFQTDNRRVLRLAASGQFEAVGVGSASLIAQYRTLKATNRVTVVAIPGVPETPELAHRYSFGPGSDPTVVSDLVGGADGQITGSPTFQNDKLTLNGGYVTLPGGLLSGFTNLTLEAWVTWAGGTNDNQAIWDFGSTLATGDPVTRFAVSPRLPGSGHWGFQVATLSQGDAQLEAPTTLPTNQAVQIVLSYNSVAQVARLYLNGAKVATASFGHALAELNDRDNYLGIGQGATAVSFDGVLDEFRIYNGAMLDTEVAARYVEGPGSTPAPAEPPALTLGRSGTTRFLSWPTAATGYALESTAKLGTNAVWTAVAESPTVDGTNNVLTLDTSRGTTFYRLKR